VRHIWIDEAGKVSLYFWENAVARAAFRDCPIDLTSSPYALNWLYKQFVRPIMQDRRSRPDVELIQAASDENPSFPKKAIEDARLTMDPRRFRAMFGGVWEKMTGLVYDCFDDEENVCEPFALPTGTRFVGGIDWGFSNPFALVVRAITPDDKHYQVYEFYRTAQTLAQKIEAARQAASIFQVKPWYADPSDPASIQAFNEAGLSCIPADNDIKAGLDNHYELIKTRRYKVFRGSSPHTIDEYESYHWPEEKLDVSPDKDIKEQTPVKQNEHSMDANRYVSRMTRRGMAKHTPKVAEEKKQEDQYARLERLKRKSRSGGEEKWTA
jgi:phage terminase large subunit